MRMRLRGRRSVVLVGAAGIAASLAIVGTAGASTQGAANSIIVGSGSATTYQVMTSLDDLFNGLSGCNLIAVPSGGVTPPQPLNYACTPAASSSPLQSGNFENPSNDVAVREPAIGSSNGIEQLELQGSGVPLPSTDTAPATINYAASSRAAKSTDLQGLNFVAYAKDGVDWFHFTEIAGKPTDSAGCTNLSQQTIQAIWTNTAPSGTDKLITNWNQVYNVGAKTPCGSGALDQYTAQSGSGTQSTWDGFLACASGVNCDENAIIARGSAYANTHIIFENEDLKIINNKDEADAIFFFSYGKYVVSCKTVCGGSPVPGTTTKLPSKGVLGEINGLSPSPTSILGTNPTDIWPVDRYLYNVYSNGSNTNIGPIATQATLNLVSEDGFLCKPNVVGVHSILDPTTDVPMREEIETVIAANGFLPLDELSWVKGVPGTGKDFLEGSVANPAVINTAPYDNAWGDPALPTSHDYTGYCLVTTTDGNASST